MFKLGYIDYLNCYPFYHHFFVKEDLPGVKIFPGHPEELNILMGNGGLDMSPISAAAYAAVQDKVLILADFCLSSVGYVKSVILRSSVPIEHLNNKTIGLTTASRTSVILLKILLEKYYCIRPLYTQIASNPVMQDIDAALVIGNEALLAEKNPVAYSYDLGDLWFRKTGHAVVFAVFAVRASLRDEPNNKVQDIIASYNKSMVLYREATAEVIAAARKRYPDVVYDIQGYYNVLRFGFSEELKKALLFYYAEAYSLGLLNKIEMIEFW